MDGEGLDIAHNGVRGDDDVDPSPGLSGITVAQQGRGESSRLEKHASSGMTKQRS